MLFESNSSALRLARVADIVETCFRLPPSSWSSRRNIKAQRFRARCRRSSLPSRADSITQMLMYNKRGVTSLDQRTRDHRQLPCQEPRSLGTTPQKVTALTTWLMERFVITLPGFITSAISLLHPAMRQTLLDTQSATTTGSMYTRYVPFELSIRKQRSRERSAAIVRNQPLLRRILEHWFNSSMAHLQTLG